MKIIETALLYIDFPAPAFAGLADILNARVAPFGVTLTAVNSDLGSQAVFAGEDLQVIVSAHEHALPADGFLQSMESPLSAPFQGILSETLFRHRKHITITVMLGDQSTEQSASDSYLRALCVAHAASTIVCEWSQPSAVHWRQSNQLITAAQYEKLASETTPWALFAQAKVFSTSVAPVGERQFGLRIDEAEQFIGRPILFQESDWPVEQTYALALSFLRHAVQTGAPIADGHSFGPEGGEHVGVTHVDASPELPKGRFLLHAISGDRSDAATGSEGGNRARVSRKERKAQPNGLPGERDRTRSMAISYLMLVIMPPVGLFLLISNVFFGSNAARTGLIASTAVAMAVLVGAFTFVYGFGDSKTALMDQEPISTTRLSN